ncbi:S-adenosyl-L-methionine-dependent methyltransferase [Elsinoe ampelina]|uniref:S-adenosyl-L-methionine-dependent methyltransferase n=1 Tax=Elsinoe ampelina TaxID=302913 RepID=A0A6A6FYE4_9PEZI|nr:S-adenosyl-L-methionine-dependent methyltransferase [Elsinoe ampelina]
MTDLAESTRKLWNKYASQYDTGDWQKELFKQVTAFIQDSVSNGLLDLPPKDGGVSLLDYACGTGKITLALKDHITSALGIDISDGMVDIYNARMSEAGVPNAHAVVGNLLSEQGLTGELDKEAHNFDIAFVGFGFHHFEDPELTIKRLSSRLKPGGFIAILDWLPSDEDPQYKAEEGAGHHYHHHHHGHGHKHGHGSAQSSEPQHTIHHDGFSQSTMEKLYSQAGLVDFGFATMEKPLVIEMGGKRVERTGFIAKARRSS